MFARAILACVVLVGGHAAALAEPPALIDIADGSYRAVAPPQWDGKSALPLLLYLHGYGQSSASVTGEADLVAAATGMGVLMVVPDGVDHAWAHVGAPTHKRDDLAFLAAVVADAEARFPVDRARVYAAGFSIGGSMVWDLACHAPAGFAAFLPVSGAFWLPYPRDCAGPVNLRHVHGLTDTTVPMAGRTIFGSYTQGDVLKGWEILRATDRCAVEPDRKSTEDDLACDTWSSCAGSHTLALCLHGDGHDMAPRYLKSGLAWAMGLGR